MLINRIRSAKLDGTDVQQITTSLADQYAIEIDQVERKLYWTERLSGLRRANLDGTDVEVLDPNPATGLGLDLLTASIYWVRDGLQIMRADLDGANAQVAIDPSSCP